MGAYVDSIKTSDGTKHPIQDNTIFEGTQAEWDLLTSEQKATYRLINITDDYDAPYEEPEIWGFIDHMNILDPSQRIEYIKTNRNYTPLTISSSTHTANYGSWEGNPILQANVPAMIKSDGTVDYYLDPDDYTKKLDGTPSDVANTAYEGGAFAYIPKIYTRQYIKGNDRYVMFSMTKVNNDFKPTGFVDHLGNEYDGMWIPMFYGDLIIQNNVQKILSLVTGNDIAQTYGCHYQKTYIENGMPTAKFFGGPIIPLICDLLILFAKTTNMESAYGYGNSYPTGGWLPNQIIGGGQFYGTWVDGGGFNKVFHSVVPITCQQEARDPYTLLFNGRLKVSPYYYYDITDESGYLIDTGIDYTNTNNNIYPSKMAYIPNYGAILITGTSDGSASLAYCDALYVKTDINGAALTRFGHGAMLHANGPFNTGFGVIATGYLGNLLNASPMVFGALSQQQQGGA